MPRNQPSLFDLTPAPVVGALGTFLKPLPHSLNANEPQKPTNMLSMAYRAEPGMFCRLCSSRETSMQSA